MIKNKNMSENQITQEEAKANHDAWWNSLTNEDKEKLYNEMVESGVFLPHFDELKSGNPLTMGKEFFVEMISDYNKLKLDYDATANKKEHELHTLI